MPLAGDGSQRSRAVPEVKEKGVGNTRRRASRHKMWLSRLRGTCSRDMYRNSLVARELHTIGAAGRQSANLAAVAAARFLLFDNSPKPVWQCGLAAPPRIKSGRASTLQRASRISSLWGEDPPEAGAPAAPGRRASSWQRASRMRSRPPNPLRMRLAPLLGGSFRPDPPKNRLFGRKPGRRGPGIGAAEDCRNAWPQNHLRL